MKLTLIVLATACAVFAISCAPTRPMPPVAKKKPVELELHGDVRFDDYFWLRERTNPEVLTYLEAENAYTDAVMAGTVALQEELFEELKNRIQPDESTVPALKNGYYYYKRFEKGLEYPIHCRREGSVDAPEQIILDVNRVAKGHDFTSVRGVSTSPDGRMLAWALDTVGRRKYTLFFTDLETGEVMPDKIPVVTGDLAWANDNRTLFYAKQDPETLRSYQVYRHMLGTDPSEDKLVFEEADPTYSVDLWKTRSDGYILIESEHTLATECRFLDADHPEGEFRVVAPRERGVEYHVAHIGDRFIIRTNLDAKNFRLMEAPVVTPGRAHWRELVPGRDDVLIESVEVFRYFMVVTEWRGGLIHLRVVPWGPEEGLEIEFDEPTYLAWVGENHDFNTQVLRYGYSSPNTPRTIYDVDLATRVRTLKQRIQVGGGFESANYTVELVMAPARDGVGVPVSIVYRNGLERDGSNPALLYAYGSYGSSEEAKFRPEIISLLDRGFVFALAHIRGGQELGRWWYEDGKLLNKKNTFNDFVDCGRYLVDQGFTSPDGLFAMGRSAGGLLMGAVSNMAPDLFAGIIAEVPWVDVVTTMLDHDIPLTTSEFDEWGNPEDPEFYAYMLSYSPYDNIEAKDYPAMFITTAFEDSQVQYFEPAKWVAKLRVMKTDDKPVLFICEMEAAGHGGVSGRYKQYRETAMEYAFMLEILDGTLKR
jgi:oligopeptidase B